MPPPNNTILVVDDNESVLYARARILRRAGYRVLEASTGRQGLDLVASQRPELVILDIHLPDVSGLQICRAIKGDPALAIIPVLHTSATSISSTDQVLGFEGGADGYLVEPVPPEVLVATVGALLRMYRAEREARESRRAMDVLVSNLPGAAYSCDELGGPLSFVSGGVTELIGHSPTSMLSRPRGWWDLILPEDLRAVHEQVQLAGNGTAIELTYRLRHADGSVRWIWDRVAPVRREAGGVFWEGFATDVTDRRRAQEMLSREHDRLDRLVREKTIELESSHEQLRLSERLAGLGTLAAGLGHDMGNLLLPMRIHLESLKQLPLPSSAAEELDAVAECCGYLNQLAAGLKLLAVDPAGASAEPVELHQWWEEAAPLLRSALPRHVELQQSLPAGSCLVPMSRTALTQAVFNLVQNAGQAMAGQARGAVRVSAECDLGQKVVLSVSDDGPGMPPEVVRRCMEPFYTTKPRGQSTGLGLALVRSLVADARGEVRIESDLGAGTTFSLVLPAVKPAEPPSPAGPAEVCIEVSSPRLRAAIADEARRLACQIVPVLSSGAARAVLVTDRPVPEPTSHKVVFVGPAHDAPPDAQVLRPNARSKEVRDALRRSLGRAS